MIAWNSASSSENDVSIRHWISGWRERTSRHTSTPLPSGRRTSSTATSGRVGGMRAQRLVGGARLADHDDVARVLEQLADPAPHDLVVVEQEHPNLVAVGCGACRSVIGWLSSVGGPLVVATRLSTRAETSHGREVPVRPAARRGDRSRIGSEPTGRAAPHRRVCGITLVDARYGALGVLGDTGTLTRLRDRRSRRRDHRGHRPAPGGQGHPRTC